MHHPGGIEAVQSGLRHHHRPVGMAAARLLQRVQHRLLVRVLHLHHDQHEVRLLLAPRDVVRRIVVHLAESAGIEKAQQRGLGRHVVEAGRARAGLEPKSDLGARIAGERSDDRGLAGAGLPEQPHDQRAGLGTLARTLRGGAVRVRRQRRTTIR